MSAAPLMVSCIAALRWTTRSMLQAHRGASLQQGGLSATYARRLVAEALAGARPEPKGDHAAGSLAASKHLFCRVAHALAKFGNLLSSISFISFIFFPVVSIPRSVSH